MYLRVAINKNSSSNSRVDFGFEKLEDRTFSQEEIDFGVMCSESSDKNICYEIEDGGEPAERFVCFLLFPIFFIKYFKIFFREG